MAAQTRPDLSFTLGALARFSHNLGPIYIKASNRFLQYLKYTQYLGISYEAVQNHGNLQAYSDADYAGDAETRKSTTGYLFKLANGPITWKSARQHCVTLSSTEAEYVALCQTGKEAIWLQSFLQELKFTGNTTPITIQGDNTASHSWSLNPESHQRTKHIDV